MSKPVAYLRDAQPLADDPALVVCAKGDPGAVAVYVDDAHDKLVEALSPFAFIAKADTHSHSGASVIVNINRCRDALRLLAELGETDADEAAAALAAESRP